MFVVGRNKRKKPSVATSLPKRVGASIEPFELETDDGLFFLLTDRGLSELSATTRSVFETHEDHDMALEIYF